MPTNYAKPAMPLDDLITFLEGKGLTVGDRPYALNRLRYIGYYRLKIYTRTFEDAGKQFVPGTRFEDIVELYEFDRRLRLVFLDAIERIEVSLRATLIEVMTAVGGPHFYLNAAYFDPPPRPGADSGHVVAAKLAADADHKSIRHYKATYNNPVEPPIWCLLEGAMFGSLSRIISGLLRVHRKSIASAFNIDEKILVSWARSLGSLRNICAHHQRLWNADLHVNAPKVSNALRGEIQDIRNLYARVAIMKTLLDSAYPNGAIAWAKRLGEIIDTAKPAWLTAMGFPTGWKTRPLWAAAFI